LLSVGGYFLTEGKIGLLSVSSLFLRRVGVYVGVCVYAHTHTHTAQMGYSDVSPGVGRDETPGGPEESGWTKSRHVNICIRAQSTHVYVYARKWDEILD